MIFKDWTYRKKNRGLIVLSAILLLASWYLAFGKTYTLLAGYSRLKKAVAGVEEQGGSKQVLRNKLALQDSLIQHYRADSAIWVSGLLQEVGHMLSAHSVGVSFENKAVGTSVHTVERELVLTGSFEQLQRALSQLETAFFVKAVRAYVDKEQLRYTVRLAVVKGVGE